MKNLTRTVLISSGLLVGGLMANAQYRYDPNYGDSGRYSDNRYGGYGSSRGSLIGRVMSDIDRAASNSRFDNHERKHFEETSRRLQEFEERWSRGNFDTGRLDRAIENLQHLAEADQLRGRDRDILSQDLAELRQFRSTRGRYSNNGYRDRDYGGNRDYGYRDYGDDRYYRRY